MSTKNRANSAQTSGPKSISDHLGELRRRLTWVVLMLIAMCALAYMVNDTLVSFVLAPIGDQKLVYLTPGGGFTFIFQIVLYAGLLLSAPVATYHAYRFVAPALPERMRHQGLRVVVMSSLLMLAGASFGYFVAVPAALQFLTAFAGDFVQANLTADSYLNFLVAYVLGLSLLFQLPLFLIAWNWLNPLPPGRLLSSQRYVIVGAFIAAALLTPTPDVFNQCLLAIPIIAVYQLGVVSVYMVNRTSRQTSGEDRQVRQAPQFEKPVFDVTALLGTDKGPADDLVKPHKVHIKRSVAGSARVETPIISTDGFRQARTSVLSAPNRHQPLLRPTLNRTRNTNQVPLVSARNDQTRSIDGFTFV